MIPTLKDTTWERDGEDLTLVDGSGRHIALADPTGSTERLLKLLEPGVHSVPELVGELDPTDPDLDALQLREALDVLDGLGLLVDAAEEHRLSERERERYFSNLAFFSMYAGLEHGPLSRQQAIVDSHVVVLGAGGLCSTVLLNLAGLGVGRLTVLDFDRVALKNFARQYLYRERDLGLPKAERAAAWVREFNSGIDVRHVDRRIEGPGDIADLLDGADLVVSGVDYPGILIDEWVNEACVSAGVPFVRGGMSGGQVVYWSVIPGRTPCRACHFHGVDAELALDPESLRLRELMLRRPRVNRGIGPVASFIGSLVAMEALRYLSGFAQPLSAGAFVTVDVCTGEMETLPMRSWADCPLCRGAR